MIFTLEINASVDWVDKFSKNNPFDTSNVLGCINSLYRIDEFHFGEEKIRIVYCDDVFDGDCFVEFFLKYIEVIFKTGADSVSFQFTEESGNDFNGEISFDSIQEFYEFSNIESIEEFFDCDCFD